MIDVRGLTKTYGRSRGVQELTFSVKEGEIVGFLGPNGAGKTTVMNILTGYLSSTSGEVRIQGLDILADPVAAKRHIGYLPEQPPLYLDMTVAEYLGFVYELKGVKSRKKEHIAHAARMADIGEVTHRVIRNLSKGYRQRVGLAQALIGDPDVLILDEPTVGLDPKQIKEIRQLIKTLGQSRTVLLSTHILPEVSAVCERVLMLSEGVIVADDRPERLAALVTNDRGLTVRIAGPRDNVLSLLRARDGVKSARVLGEPEEGAWEYLVEVEENTDIRRPLFAALAAAQYPILRLAPRGVSLEEIFLKLTAQRAQGEEDAL